MKGQFAALLIVLFLFIGVLIFGIITNLFVPILKTIIPTPVLEAPAVGAITAFLGFLPDQCSVLSSLECRFCLVMDKVVPLVVNITLGLVLFSVLLRFLSPIIGWGGERGFDRDSGLSKGHPQFYSAVLLISIAFSIFMLHQPNPLVYLSWITMLLAISVRLIGVFILEEQGGRSPIADVRRLTDFFLAANIIVVGWNNLWIFPIVIIAGFIMATTIEEGAPRVHFRQWHLLILLLMLLAISGYLYGVLEGVLPLPFIGQIFGLPFDTLPEPIRYPGLAQFILERFEFLGIREIECGNNTIGPDSSISL